MNDRCRDENWHKGSDCDFDDLRNMVTSFVLVKSDYSVVSVEVKHGIHALDSEDGYKLYKVAEFRAEASSLTPENLD